jgi:hypothetical protein
MAKGPCVLKMIIRVHSRGHMKLSRQIQQIVRETSVHIHSNETFQEWAPSLWRSKGCAKLSCQRCLVMSASSVVTKPSCLPFRALVIALVGSIRSVIKGRAQKRASPLHTSVQCAGVLTVPIPKPGCLLGPFDTLSLLRCHRPSKVEHVQTQVWGLKVDFLQLVTWRLSKGECPHTHTRRSQKR